MTGRNQHFIPRHVLKGFAIRDSPEFSWEYRADAAPKRRRLKKIARAYHFYSEPRADVEQTLDDAITAYEDAMARKIFSLRSGPPGPLNDPALATEIIVHLSIRGDNVRGSMTHGMRLMMGHLFSLFSREDELRQLLGLESKEPGERFKDQVLRSILEHPGIRQSGLPEAVVERVAFGMTREILPGVLERRGPVLRAALAYSHERADSVVRNRHNELLAKEIAPALRVAELNQLSWSVVETAFNVVLPDCVAIGIGKDGQARPVFMSEPGDDHVSAAMALSSNRLLVGHAAGAAPFEIGLFNLHAIACSETFFVSAITTSELAEWSRYIGVRSRTILNKTADEAFAEFKPPIEGPPEPDLQADVNFPPLPKGPRLPSCEIHFHGCERQPTVQGIPETVSGVMAKMADFIPLARLDGITFAADYPAALAALDRGFEGTVPLTTTDEQGAVGVAMTPVVCRNGVVKAHVVLRDYVGRALICGDETSWKSALRILVAQFAQVGCVELFDSAFPGVLLRPLGNQFDMLRYRYVDNAWTGYFSARVSAPLAPEGGEGHISLLVAALQRAAEEIPRLRLQYRFHRDVPRMMEAVLEQVGFVLSHAAYLIGHHDGSQDASMDTSGVLAGQLEQQGLSDWFNLYRSDLRALWERRGEWASLEEFLALGHHIERLLWPHGLFLWQTPEGDGRVAAPVYFDRHALSVGRQKCLLAP